MSKKKTKMSLQEVKKMIMPVGKYFNSKKPTRLFNVFASKKSKGSSTFIINGSFKQWLRRVATPEAYDAIIEEKKVQMKKYVDDASSRNMSTDKYYTKKLSASGLNRNDTKGKNMTEKAIIQKLLNPQTPEEEKTVSFGTPESENKNKIPNTLSDVMEDKQQELKQQKMMENPQEVKKPRKPRKKEEEGSRKKKAMEKKAFDMESERIESGEGNVMDDVEGLSKSGVHKKRVDKVLNNIQNLNKEHQLQEEKEWKQKVRVVAQKISSDITDPTSGENNYENVQTAISDFKHDTGKGIHTDAMMRNVSNVKPREQMVDAYSAKREMMTDLMLSKSTPAEDRKVPSRGGYKKEMEKAKLISKRPEYEDEEEEEEPELRGQTQEQNMGGRQRIRGRRPPQPQAPQAPQAMQDNLTIPQEVERDADGGDGRLGISPSSEPQMDIQSETIARNKKTIQQLRMECQCFKEVFKDKIKTKKFKALMNVDLKKKSLEEIRRIHKHYSEEVRDYYNSHRGLRVGVIVSPQLLGLSVQSLQNMIAPRIPTYSGAVIDAGRQAQGFVQSGSELRRKPPKGPTPAIDDKDVHYKLGGVRHATGNYDRDIESINSHIDREEDKKKSSFGRGSTRFGKPKNFKNSFYQAPKHTNISQIRLKTK